MYFLRYFGIPNSIVLVPWPDAHDAHDALLEEVTNGSTGSGGIGLLKDGQHRCIEFLTAANQSSRERTDSNKALASHFDSRHKQS